MRLTRAMDRQVYVRNGRSDGSAFWLAGATILLVVLHAAPSFSPWRIRVRRWSPA